MGHAAKHGGVACRANASPKDAAGSGGGVAFRTPSFGTRTGSGAISSALGLDMRTHIFGDEFLLRKACTLKADALEFIPSSPPSGGVDGPSCISPPFVTGGATAAGNDLYILSLEQLVGAQNATIAVLTASLDVYRRVPLHGSSDGRLCLEEFDIKVEPLS